MTRATAHRSGTAEESWLDRQRWISQMQRASAAWATVESLVPGLVEVERGPQGVEPWPDLPWPMLGFNSSGFWVVVDGQLRDDPEWGRCALLSQEYGHDLLVEGVGEPIPGRVLRRSTVGREQRRTVVAEDLPSFFGEAAEVSLRAVRTAERAWDPSLGPFWAPSGRGLGEAAFPEVVQALVDASVAVW